MSNKSERINQLRDELSQKEKELKKKKRELASTCDHKKKSGKLSVEPLDDGTFRCKKCGQEFSLNKINRKEAIKSAEVLNDMIQQIKCFSNGDEQDDKIMKDLGYMSCSLETVLELYNKCLKSAGKKDKKKDKEKYGNYGFQGMSFLKK